MTTFVHGTSMRNTERLRSLKIGRRCRGEFEFQIAFSRRFSSLPLVGPTPTDSHVNCQHIKDGLFGNMYRAKYTTTGTYAGNTNVRIDLMTDGLTASP